MTEAKVIVDEPAERIRRFTLNRPERNALNDEIREELFQQLEREIEIKIYL